MPSVRRSDTAAPEWIGLNEASAMLGLSASTLRRWADTGVVRTYVTPGGHRRFSRAALQALLPRRDAILTSMQDLGETPARMVRIYRREVGQGVGDLPWVGQLADEERARFRGHGRRVVDALLAALDTADPVERSALLAVAADASSEYGRAAGSTGTPVSVTIEMFLRFRRPFLTELSSLARRRDLDAAGTTELIEQATDALDDLLLATVRAQEAAVSSSEVPNPAGAVEDRP